MIIYIYTCTFIDIDYDDDDGDDDDEEEEIQQVLRVSPLFNINKPRTMVQNTERRSPFSPWSWKGCSTWITNLVWVCVGYTYIYI